MKNLAIIPARGGSKGIKNKNIKKIAGKPLIAWTIEAALASTKTDRVVVTTDSYQIAEIASHFGAEVPFIRPEHLATDTASTESAIEHTLNWLSLNEDYHPDNIIILQCTSPVRADNCIDNAIDQFTRHGADSLLSACEFRHFLWRPADCPIAEYDYKNRPRRQDLDEACIRFKENGSIYITKAERFRLEKNRISGKITIFIMSEDESFEIDTPLDWIVVEAILKYQRG